VALTTAFGELKQRYDETKGINESLRKNEATLLEAVHKMEEELANAEARFEALRTHAEEKLVIASSEVQRSRAETQQAESSRHSLEAALAEQTKQVAFWQARALVAEAKLPGLTQGLALKERENQELLAICDQLVASLQPATTATNDAADDVITADAAEHVVISAEGGHSPPRY
jgi:transforming acidic coiled-coil-containing protein 3